MNGLSEKSWQDLEFDIVLQQVKTLAKTETGGEAVAHIRPIKNVDTLMYQLKLTEEYKASLTGDNRIPEHEFENISTVLKRLKIDNYTLDIRSFQKIEALVKTANQLVRFFEDFKTFYQQLHLLSKPEFHNTAILQKIDYVIDRFGEVRDQASENLGQIRKRLHVVRGQVNQSFQKALSRYAGAGYLDDIRESIVDNRRVLAVKAMHKKQVTGKVMGTSKTGSIIFIQPEATYTYETEINNLEFEEGEEIQRILAGLTDEMRPYAFFLEEVQNYLTQIDVISAKARYAQKLNAILPYINKADSIDLREAYHPLLYLTNLQTKNPTYPQSFLLNAHQRIIVISGPNAGGKSITLKTLGLLQLMLQSGMLIPVKPGSSTCLFGKILTDIGDNQSIDNHLSTYSYRLKNMRRFLKKCQADTLFLIDEFGSGTDPELGGALAEAILEEFYHRGAYGIITTHYANLKRMADQWPEISNANMVFDHQSLHPTYHLQMGEAGSSYTFEVAQKNGIPYSLINKARKKVERGKIKFDESIAKLRKEKDKFAKEREKLEAESRVQDEVIRENAEIKGRIQEKLVRFQELYDSHQQLISMGKKVKELAEKYRQNKRKKPLLDALLKMVEIENAKVTPPVSTETSQPTSKRKKLTPEPKKENLLEEIKPELEKIRKKKKAQKASRTNEKEQTTVKRPGRVGDRVRLESGKAVGTIDKIEKQTATVNYGHFTTLVKLNQLELVEKGK